ncbi:MAG: glycosyltransferase [Alphaproteobacteria bacterium]|nr:glycosyltransferase [Alphaproteobacteria bacterium]
MKIMFIRNRNVLNTKWLVQYINALQQARPDYEIEVVCDTYKKVGSELTFDEKVRLINLDGKTDNPLINIFHRIRCKITPGWFRHKKLIEKENPDVIVCYFPTDLFNVTMFQHHNIPIIMMLHNVPDVILGKYKNNPIDATFDDLHKEIQPLRWFHHQTFKQVSVWQVLLSSFKPLLDKEFAPKKIVAIPNMVQQLSPQDYADLSVEKKKIIYVARIERDVKRQHRLVEAFGKVAKDFPDWSVEFWGLHKYPKYGEEIMAIAHYYNIQDRVFIKGYTTDILSVYKNADIHAFPSKYEGFGLGIADGQASGLPTLGFAEAPAVNELIIDGHNGFLASDMEDFADKLAILMKDKELRIKFGRNAIEDVKAFAPDNVIRMWTKLLDETVAEKQNA